MNTINSTSSLALVLREISAATDAELQEFAGSHEAYDGHKFCVQAMWARFSSDALPKFAATVLKNRCEGVETELINTGE